MEQRISLITLGVSDLDRSARFYEQIGWKRVETEEGIVAFDLIGQTLALYPLEDLRRDIGAELPDRGFSGITLAHNVDDDAVVDLITARAEAAGAEVLRPPSRIFWGGYIAYFADPDGHIWEIANNPHSPLGPKGEFRWKGYGK